ncbi:hypothetical protein OS493_008429 [Desmophyllum pertusum]|uniref:Metalloendopeptidase n=1 Tax=Desmophyllum pertusum TaxID=174260 RepID=A0A9X0A7U0_9CNID|nr:hypothetical protein OS493_008429 [Desmophyllum pertusum]
MEEWTSKTCITFKKRTNERGYANFKLGSGCSSYVGRTGSRQDINLARGCWHRGIVAHEIGNKFNFNKYNRGTIDSLGTKYDYGSVMHYGGRAFSKNGKPTIVSKQSGETAVQTRTVDAPGWNAKYLQLS